MHMQAARFETPGYREQCRTRLLPGLLSAKCGTNMVDASPLPSQLSTGHATRTTLRSKSFIEPLMLLCSAGEIACVSQDEAQAALEQAR
mmetsp:Transcript_1491/g.4512  ORF Transcript_1491/g.4512 Transcript_1491/m.4512 type:complete len:89 (+) Transcript_1491:1531-1797(+)